MNCRNRFSKSAPIRWPAKKRSPICARCFPAKSIWASTPAPVTDFAVILRTGWIHLPEGGSAECKLIATEPPQPEATYRVETMGPGVVPGQNIRGILDLAGQGRFQVRITQLGPYTNIVFVTSRTTNVERNATAMLQ